MYWALLTKIHADGGRGRPRRSRVAVAGGASSPVEVLKDFEAHLRHPDPGGLRPVGDLPGGQLQPARPAHQARHDRHADLGRGDELVDDDWNTIEGEGPGEIAIRGHNVMKGYYNRPEATAEVMRDGWFRTGDIATRDEDGYYYIIDRAKDMIIRGGFNVYPREIEEVLMTHPAVSLAAVVGVAARLARRGGQGLRHPRRPARRSPRTS